MLKLQHQYLFSQILTHLDAIYIKYFILFYLIYIFFAAFFSLCKRQTSHAMRCKWFLIINSCFTVIRYTCRFISGISQWDRVTFREVHWYCTLTLYVLIKSLCGLCVCLHVIISTDWQCKGHDWPAITDAIHCFYLLSNDRWDFRCHLKHCNFVHLILIPIHQVWMRSAYTKIKTSFHSLCYK